MTKENSSQLDPIPELQFDPIPERTYSNGGWQPRIGTKGEPYAWAFALAVTGVGYLIQPGLHDAQSPEALESEGEVTTLQIKGSSCKGADIVRASADHAKVVLPPGCRLTLLRASPAP